MTEKDALTARQAAELLGIRRQTLYAYVSRGLVRSVESEGGRDRRYPRADIEKLLQRQVIRRQPAKAVEEALHFGAPVLESALTLISEGRIFYRGLDACELSRHRSIESVAAWLWLGDFEKGATLFPEARERSETGHPRDARDAPPKGARQFPGRPSPTPEPLQTPESAAEPTADSTLGAPWCLERMQAALPFFAAADPAAWAARRPREAAAAGARLVSSMVRLAARGASAPTLADTLATGWGSTSPQAASLIDAALILCADHELNVSAFTARCVASAGSPLASVVAAGLSALQGPKHGGHTRRMEALLREAGGPQGFRAAVTSRLRRGEAVPGYGQVLYPNGDPRFGELVQRLRLAAADPESRLDPEVIAWIDAMIETGEELLGEHPTIDGGLVVLSRGLGLPTDAALALFALGRTVGWIGQAIEQYGSDRLIRPRARYIGESPAG